MSSYFIFTTHIFYSAYLVHVFSIIKYSQLFNFTSNVSPFLPGVFYIIRNMHFAAKDIHVSCMFVSVMNAKLKSDEEVFQLTCGAPVVLPKHMSDTCVWSISTNN